MPKTPTWLVDESVCADLLERVLTVEYVTNCLRTVEASMASSQGEVDQRIQAAEAELKEQKARLTRLLTVIERKGMNDLIEQQYDRANERYLALSAQISSLRASQAQTRDQHLTDEDIVCYVQDMRQVLLDGSIEKRQELLRQFIRRVTLHLDHVLIEYTFRFDVPMHRISTRFLGADGNGGLRVGPSWGRQATERHSSQYLASCLGCRSRSNHVILLSGCLPASTSAMT
jgi:hypothetical protein